MKYEGSGYVLSTGKRFYANGGILGLGVTPGEMTEGYDGICEYSQNGGEDDGVRFTPEERFEIAAFMIARWTRWAREDIGDGKP